MKKRVFIGIGVAVPLLAVYIIVANGLFSSPNTILEDYRMHEKSLVKLFEKYEKESETMSDDEFTTWQNEVNELNNKAAKTLRIVRESLSDILDRDFADSVLKQLQRTEK